MRYKMRAGASGVNGDKGRKGERRSENDGREGEVGKLMGLGGREMEGEVRKLKGGGKETVLFLFFFCTGCGGSLYMPKH